VTEKRKFARFQGKIWERKGREDRIKERAVRREG
jgi:hypothetical protein